MEHNLLYVPTFYPVTVSPWTTSPAPTSPSGRPAGRRAGGTPLSPRPRAQRLPRRRRTGRGQGRSLPGPRPGGQRRIGHCRGAGALDLRRAAVEPLGQGLRPRLHGLRPPHAGPGRHPPGGHRRPRQALQARPARGRHDVGHRRHGACPCSAAPTSSSRPRGWSPGRPPRTSPPSRPPASRRTPRPR